ncbi:hypothetical protein JCM6882_007389 [Rhodosporidiobolus microsporus]
MESHVHVARSPRAHASTSSLLPSISPPGGDHSSAASSAAPASISVPTKNSSTTTTCAAAVAAPDQSFFNLAETLQSRSEGSGGGLNELRRKQEVKVQEAQAWTKRPGLAVFLDDGFPPPPTGPRSSLPAKPRGSWKRPALSDTTNAASAVQRPLQRSRLAPASVNPLPPPDSPTNSRCQTVAHSAAPPATLTPLRPTTADSTRAVHRSHFRFRSITAAVNSARRFLALLEEEPDQEGDDPEEEAALGDGARKS